MPATNAKIWARYIEYEIRLVNFTNRLSSLHLVGLKVVKNGISPAKAIAETEK